MKTFGVLEKENISSRYQLFSLVLLGFQAVGHCINMQMAVISADSLTSQKTGTDSTNLRNNPHFPAGAGSAGA